MGTVFAIVDSGTSMGKFTRKIPVATYRWGERADEGVLFLGMPGLGVVAKLFRDPNGYRACIEDPEADWFESVGYFEDKSAALYATLRKWYGHAWPYRAYRITTTE